MLRTAEQALAALVRSLHGDPNLKTFFLAAQKSVAQEAGRKMVNRIERIQVLRDDGMELPKLLGVAEKRPSVSNAPPDFRISIRSRTGRA